MKADFLYVGLNLDTIVQEKTSETCTFNGWCFINKKHSKYLNVKSRLFSPALIKFLATCLVALLVFTKRSCALFLIWSMSDELLVAVYFIYRNWPNLNWFSQFFSIIVSLKLSEWMSFHIKCSANARYLAIAPLYTGIHYELVYHHDGRSQVSIP